MLIAVAPGPRGGATLRRLADDGTPAGPVEAVGDLAGAVAAIEGAQDVRWLWASTAEAYPPLLRAGVAVARCHDLELTEALLVGSAGEWGAPRRLAAAFARLTGAEVTPDPPVRAPEPPGEHRDTLFDPEPVEALPPGFDALDATIRVHADQVARIAATPHPGRFRLLIAAESAGALLAAEMGHEGLPWDADTHDAVLTELLGEVPPGGGQPRRLTDLAREISVAFGGARVRPDSPGEVLRAFQRAGYPVTSTRAWELRGLDHPAVPLVQRYKELYRIWTSHGWAWRHAWVRDGRFHPEYVPAGVVSGRWATRGGGALQIPRVIRASVRAEPGWRLVVADAGQLEPRILAAVADDPGMTRAAAAGDMYAALAAEAFGGDRAVAKVALLGAMYGQTGGQAAPALARLRQSYPRAYAYVEDAARTGEAGGLVRSWLGRTCPPPSASWTQGTWSAGGDEFDADAPVGRGAVARSRGRGRFTRNFVIQATAAEWALALLATLRTQLAGSPARIVFFQHDEVIVHAPEAVAGGVVDEIHKAAASATHLLFGPTPVRFPLGVAVVESYADAK